MYISLSPFYSWGKYFKEVCNVSHSLKVWLTQMPWFLHLISPHFMSEKVMLLKALSWSSLWLNSAEVKSGCASEAALFSFTTDTWNLSHTDFSALWKTLCIGPHLSSIRFLVWKPNGPRHFAIENVKMIIEAYSNHYILCKNQDILGKISAKAVESDFNESN